MLLSIEFPRLQRVTVCTLVWHGLCSFVEDCLVYHILGLLIFSSDGYKKICGAGLQNRAEGADQLVLSF